MNRPKTVFCDIDGTLIEHSDPCNILNRRPILLEGTIEKLLEWDKKCYNIILTTGRKESLRAITENQLSMAGIIYDQLVMGIGGGTRILINDLKPDSTTPTAHAFSLPRNLGIKDIDI